MSTPSPYRSLPTERRVALVEHAIRASRPVRALYIQRLAGLPGGFRAVTLQSWPPDRLAKEVVRRNAEQASEELDLLQLLYVELEPQIQIDFLDATGVKHDKGVIDESVEPPYTDADAVRRGAQTLVDKHGDDGKRYLRTIAKYNNAGWPGIDEVLAGL